MFNLRPQLNRAPTASIVPVVPMGATIPRLLHQTYPTKDLPASLADNFRRLTALNPGWQHQLFAHDDIVVFIEKHYGPRILQYYDRIDSKYGAARADLFRYLLMYQIGGVYLDIKSSLTRPLDEVLSSSDSYVLSQWSDRYPGSGRHAGLEHIPGGEFQQWHIVCVPGHPYLKAVIDNVLRNIDCYNPCWHSAGKWGVINLTGPIAYTRAIYPILQRHAHRIADFERDLGFIYTIFDEPTKWKNNTHKTMFKWHYADMTHSIIRLRVFKLLYVKLIYTARVPWRITKRALLRAVGK
jgi:mannosyltransferase OCH1-like enzyme